MGKVKGSSSSGGGGSGGGGGSSGRDAGRGAAPRVGGKSLWAEEVAAATADVEHARIVAAAKAGGGSATEVRRRKLALTVAAAKEKSHGRVRSVLAAAKAGAAAKGGSGGGGAGGGAATATGASPATHTGTSAGLFGDLLAALPTVAARPSAAEVAARSADPFAVVTQRVKPTHTGKKSRARPDLGAIAQFAALVALPSYQSNALAGLGRHFAAADAAAAAAAAAGGAGK